MDHVGPGPAHHALKQRHEFARAGDGLSWRTFAMARAMATRPALFAVAGDDAGKF
jgi:hypothetical protein